MTYTDQVRFSSEAISTSSSEKGNSTTLKKLALLKQESAQRAQRITTILRAAFSESAAEFKAGRTVIAPLAKEVTVETVAVVKENGQKVSETVNQAWQDADDNDKTERIIRFVRMLAAKAKETLFPYLEQQTGRLDNWLSDQYGDRYTNIKDRVDTVCTQSVATEDISFKVEDTTVSSVIEVDSEVIR